MSEGDSVNPTFTPPARTASAPAAVAATPGFGAHAAAFNFRAGSKLPGRPGATNAAPANRQGQTPPPDRSPPTKSPQPGRSPARSPAPAQTSDVYEVDFLKSLEDKMILSDNVRAFCSDLWGEDAARPEHLWSRDGMFSKQPAVKQRERKLSNMVLGVLAKLTPENYDKLQAELIGLPIRQSEEAEITEVVRTMYEKAVRPEDELYVELYARLMADLVQHYVEQKSPVGQLIRKAIIDRCQMQFEQPFRLSDEEMKDENGDDLPQEEIDFKKSRLKDKLRSNIKFLGHLFVSHMITEKVVNFILFELLYGKQSDQARARKRKPEEYELEMFCDLLRKVIADLSPRIRDEYIPGYMQSIQNLTTSGSLSLRIKFMLQDLLDLQKNNWKDSRKRHQQQGPMTLKDFEVQQEQEKLRQQREVDQMLSAQQQSRNRHHSHNSPKLAQPTAVMKKEVPLPPKENVLAAIESYKANHVPSVLDEFFQPIPKQHRADFLEHWIQRAVRAFKREDERQIVGDVITNVVRERLIDEAAILAMMQNIATMVVEEFEDQPKIFQCWAQVIASGNMYVTPELHSFLLSQMLETAQTMPVLIKMITDVLDTQPKVINDPRDIPRRFRLLPRVLAFEPWKKKPVQEGEEEEEDEDDDDDYEEGDQHDDLFGALMAKDRVSGDLELRSFDYLLNNKAAKLADIYRHDANRADPQVAMKMACSIFTFTRCDESDEKRELMKCKDALTTVVRAAKDNDMNILIESYLTWRDLDKLPQNSFARFIEFCFKTLKLDIDTLRNFKTWMVKHFRKDGDVEILDRIYK